MSKDTLRTIEAVCLLPLLPQPAKELVYAGTSSIMSITVCLRWAEADAVIFNFVPLDSAQWASIPLT